MGRFGGCVRWWFERGGLDGGGRCELCGRKGGVWTLTFWMALDGGCSGLTLDAGFAAFPISVNVLLQRFYDCDGAFDDLGGRDQTRFSVLHYSSNDFDPIMASEAVAVFPCLDPSSTASSVASTKDSDSARHSPAMAAY